MEKMAADIAEKAMPLHKKLTASAASGTGTKLNNISDVYWHRF